MHQDTKSVVRFGVIALVVVGLAMWMISGVVEIEPTEPAVVEADEELIENSGGTWVVDTSNNLFYAPPVLSLEETCEAIRQMPARDVKAFEAWMWNDEDKELASILACMYGRLF
jgi:hypothetical protein